MHAAPKLKACNRIFERIASGEKEDSVVYNSERYGILMVLARDAVHNSHVLLVPHECEPNVDKLSTPAYTRLFIASRHIGAALDRAYGLSVDDRVGQLVSGTDVTHAHVHRFVIHNGNGVSTPKSGNLPWRRFARDEPFLSRTEGEVNVHLDWIGRHFATEEQAAMEMELAAVPDIR